MPRIAGVDVPNNKRAEVALTDIYGIGRSRALEILERAEIDPNSHPESWSEDETRRVRRLIEDNYTVEGALRTETQLNIKRLPWASSPARAPRPRPADADERAHPQGPPPRRRRQEEGPPQVESF